MLNQSELNLLRDHARLLTMDQDDDARYSAVALVADELASHVQRRSGRPLSSEELRVSVYAALDAVLKIEEVCRIK